MKTAAAETDAADGHSEPAPVAMFEQMSAVLPETPAVGRRSEDEEEPGLNWWRWEVRALLGGSPVAMPADYTEERKAVESRIVSFPEGSMVTRGSGHNLGILAKANHDYEVSHQYKKPRIQQKNYDKDLHGFAPHQQETCHHGEQVGIMVAAAAAEVDVVVVMLVFAGAAAAPALLDFGTVLNSSSPRCLLPPQGFCLVSHRLMVGLDVIHRLQGRKLATQASKGARRSSENLAQPPHIQSHVF